MPDYNLPDGPLAAYLGVRDSNRRMGMQQQASDLHQAVGYVGILSALQKQKDDQDTKSALARGDIDALSRTQAGIGILSKLNEMKNAGVTGQLNSARLGQLQRTEAEAGQQAQTRGALANLLSPGGSFGQGTDQERPNAQVFNNDADAIAAMQAAEAKGQPFTGNVPNPSNVRALAVAANPNSINEVLRQLQPKTPTAPAAFNLSPGQVRFGADGKQIAALPDRPQQEPLVTIQNPDGSVVYAPRSQAVGQKVGSRTTDTAIGKQVQQLGRDFEKAGLNSTIPVVQQAAKITPEIAGFITGFKSMTPDLAVSPEIRTARQDVQKLFNIVLKDRSGAAVTNQELERLKTEFGKGVFKTPVQLMDAIAKAKNIVEKHYQGIAASYGQNALDAYNQNLESIGGTPFKRSGSPANTNSVIDQADAIINGNR